MTRMSQYNRQQDLSCSNRNAPIKDVSISNIIYASMLLAMFETSQFSQVIPTLKFFHFMLASCIAFEELLCFLFAKWYLLIKHACSIEGWPYISPWPWIGPKNKKCCTSAHINTPNVKERQCTKDIWKRVQNIAFSKPCI